MDKADFMHIYSSRRLWISFSIFFLFAICPAPSLSQGIPQRTIESGRISGLTTGESPAVHVFKGIPYAAPPIGGGRWSPPRPVAPWESVRECTRFGPACPQTDFLFRLYGTKLDHTSEDCLYLNVWSPAGGGNEKRPVMFWVHGGGNIAGAASEPHYDGAALAKQGVVVVTINYRLGVFGYFAHPFLSRESEHNASGNYGLLDQIAALKWVQRNIHAFGGDPDCVTLFGQSAGALSVCCLLASPLARGLFHRAIVQSSPYPLAPLRQLRLPRPGMESMEEQGLRLANELGCAQARDPLAQLRALPAERLLAGSHATVDQSGNRFAPVIDGWVMPKDIAEIFNEGKQTKVPFIIGSTAREGTIFTKDMVIEDMNIPSYRAGVERLFGNLAGDFLELYPVKRESDILKAMSDSLGDRFVAGARAMARKMANLNAGVYLYHFTREDPGRSGRVLGAYHGIEIPYVFNNLEKTRGPSDSRSRALAEIMSGAWVQFARTGNPNQNGKLAWPAYDPAKDNHLEFGDSIQIGQGLRRRACDFFEEFYARQHIPRPAHLP